jgi:flagellar basal-body rod protein FlgF
MRVDIPANKTVAILTAAQISREEDLNIASHNIANAQTKGFRAFYARRESLDYELKNGEVYTYPLVSGVLQRKNRGNFSKSQNPYSVALNSEGFFAIKTPRGIRYTRNGDFKVDKNFNLVTQNGYPVLSKDQSEIKLTSPDIKIQANGSILEKNKKAGAIGVFNVDGNLQEDGENLLKGTSALKPATHIDIVSGWLEDSNVSPIEENVHLIEILRHFEQAQRMIEESDQAQKRLINLNMK